ncbi:hypothetical protein ACH5RR_010775 [Cinchona calisaya]|uniref:Uncharacterized protein n=1 Tax=Cinchona calisaya TaxID=153742 RepID=A0ABD3AK28_9GENT
MNPNLLSSPELLFGPSFLDTGLRGTSMGLCYSSCEVMMEKVVTFRLQIGNERQNRGCRVLSDTKIDCDAYMSQILFGFLYIVNLAIVLSIYVKTRVAMDVFGVISALAGAALVQFDPNNANFYPQETFDLQLDKQDSGDLKQGTADMNAFVSCFSICARFYGKIRVSGTKSSAANGENEDLLLY